MRQCLCCGEKIYGKTDLHPPCAQKVFGVKYLPGVYLEHEDIPHMEPNSHNPLSISDMQPQIPVTFNKYFKEMHKRGKRWGYFLKPPIERFKNLTQIQNLSMAIAERLNVAVPRHSLIKMQSENDQNAADANEETGSYALITKRYDRIKGVKYTYKTFSRILGKKDKYNGTLEEIGPKLWRISDIPGLDVQLYFEMLMLSFIIGNSDVHFDAFAVLYDKRRKIRLAPLKDIASTKLLDPGQPDFNVPMLGKTENITGNDFAELSRFLEIPPKAYDKMFLRFFDGKRSIGRIIKHSILDMDDKLKFSDIVNERYKRLMQ